MLKELRQGEEGQNLLIDRLAKAGYLCSLSPPRTIGYDVICQLPPKTFTVEVKYDVMSTRTGNIAVEYWNSKQNKPSGITASTSNLWCYVIGSEKEIWLTPTSKLRLFVQNEKPVKSIENGGNKNSNMLIYEKNHICSAFTRIDIMSNIEVFKLVQALTST
jgi:hypothetical protein